MKSVHLNCERITIFRNVFKERVSIFCTLHSQIRMTGIDGMDSWRQAQSLTSMISSSSFLASGTG